MNLFGITNGKEEYYLLNKDEILATFHVDDTFDMPVIDRIIGDAPLWIGDLRLFIDKRRISKSRENAVQLIKFTGCNTLIRENNMVIYARRKYALYNN